jgi:putative tryptophan/tyrosine transport system substrate-binding protein
MTSRIAHCAFRCALAAVVALSGVFCIPDASPAQHQAAARRIGVLLMARSAEHEDMQQFRQGLLDAGYTVGRDVVIDWRSANGNYEQLPKLAADLVQSKVELIVVEGTVAAQAAKQATSTIPIVMALVADPVGSGLVANLQHPGANVTGLSMMITDLDAKRLQLLKEAIPQVTRVAVLWNPDTPYHPKAIEQLKAAASSLSLEVSFFGVQTTEQFATAFSAIGRSRAQAVYAIEDPFFFSHRTRLVQLVLEARLPSMFGTRAYVDPGGLMSYGINYGERFRRSAWYVDKILKGAKAGDLPVEQPTNFELVVNLRTAKALGLAIPQSVLFRADETIK